MGLPLVLLYIALNLLSPYEMVPFLVPFRPMLILALINVPIAVLARLQAPEVGKLRVQFALVVLFLAFASVALIPHRQISGNLTTFMNLAPNVLAYFLVALYFRTPQRLRLLRGVLVAVAIFVVVNAILELPYARSAGVDTPYVLVQNPLTPIMEARIRGLGMLNDPNTFGQFLLLILPMLFVAKHDRGMGIGWLASIPITVVFVISVFLTGSRGAMLGFAVIVGLFLVRKLRATGAIIATILGALGLLAANTYKSRSISLQGGMDRLAIWSDGLSYFKAQPLWGIGPYNFTNQFGMTAHNSYLLVAAELGIIGYFLWLSAIVVTFIQLSRVPNIVGKSNPGLARWATALRISLGGYMFTSFFLSRTYELPLWMLLGMSGGVIIAAGGDEAISLRGTMWPAWSFVSCVGILGLIYIMLRLRFA
jgi:putative inorganic carbon (hco3(-)) transporter